jgi:dTDP-4-dehydrorhamnose 3,5-epimerase
MSLLIIRPRRFEDSRGWFSETWNDARLKAAGVDIQFCQDKQLLIPAGYAHGFMTLEPNCEIVYKVDDYYSADCDGGIAWDDPAIGIEWPISDVAPVLSDKDAALRPLSSLAVEFPYDGSPLGPLRDVAI